MSRNAGFSRVFCVLGENRVRVEEAQNAFLVSVLDKWRRISYNRKTICGYGGIGRRARFRFWCPRRAGSSPVTRTMFFTTSLFECVVQVVFAQQFGQDLNPAGFHIQNTVVF